MAAVPSRIGIQLSDGTVKSVYHYSRGYPRMLGRTLNYYYPTENNANTLIDGGDMHHCWTNIRWSLEGNIYLDEPAPDYYFYRGSDSPFKTHLNFEEFLNYCVEQNMFYAYIFNNGWQCYKLLGESSPKLVPTEDYMDDPNPPV